VPATPKGMARTMTSRPWTASASPAARTPDSSTSQQVEYEAGEAGPVGWHRRRRSRVGSVAPRRPVSISPRLRTWPAAVSSSGQRARTSFNAARSSLAARDRPGVRPRSAGMCGTTATRARASTHPFQAQRRAAVRRAHSKEGKIRRDPELKEFIQQRLDRRWSPEQICQVLRTAFPDELERHPAHETIDQAVYLPHRGGLESTPGVPRSGRPARRRRRRPRRARHPVHQVST
jgi:hypothetical protein